MWEKKREVRDKYNSTVGFYDDRYRDVQEEKFRRIEGHIGSVKKILDVGCGTGFLLEKISRFADLVVGVDISKRMVEEAKSRNEGVFLVLADADRLPFMNSIFDVVVSFTLLQNMPDPKRTISEMGRVVKDDGRVVLTVLEKKCTPSEVESWLISSDLIPVEFDDMPESEDFLYVAEPRK